MARDLTGWAESAKALYNRYVNELNESQIELSDVVNTAPETWGELVEKEGKIRRIEHRIDYIRYEMERI